MKETASRARVGLLLLLGVLALTAGIFFIGQKSLLFSPVFYFRVNFKSAAGVKPGSNVLLSGYNVGTVTSLALTPAGDSVTLTLRVEERIRPFVKNDAVAMIDQEGLVGNKYITLQIGTENGVPVHEYGFIRGAEPFELGAILQSARSMIDTTRFISEQVKGIMTRIGAGEGTLGKLITDDRMYDNLTQVTARADSGLSYATLQLAAVSGVVGRLAQSVEVVVRRSDSTIQNANRITAEAARFISSINEGKGTAGALLTDRALYDSLVTLVALLQNTTIDAGNAADQLAKGMYGLRTHWLLGRVFGGPSIDKEEQPRSSYEQRMRQIIQRERAVEEKERKLRSVLADSAGKGGNR